MAELEDSSFTGLISIGYNPFFGNKVKTIECYLVGYSGGDLYGQKIKLRISKYLRPESRFWSFAELVTAIAYDIKAGVEISVLTGV